MHDTICTAWGLHRSGKTADAVALLDSAIVWPQPRQVVESIAYNRAQILVDAGRCPEAEAGLREVLQLPLGASQPGFPSWDLMNSLITAMAIGGGPLDLEVVRWLLNECQDQGRWEEALNFAGILISYLIDSAPEEAGALARRWRAEADLLGEDDHVRGLTEIIRKIKKVEPD